ncbi:MAG TPA: histidine phosphatase family protein [Candidatus Corynebacterium avicola]|uniref:Histidine phosphatase family protein n=1 Tax=Candidatus Corynebacterium avicola TaxID=2838527 RepID=A0A9D1UKT6_9CORY|nr:histidine phosphatase family protein [Candidatus Corynebacterium avicola]
MTVHPGNPTDLRQSDSDGTSGSGASGSRLPERRLILIRHGQTEFNLTGRMQGQMDTPLSENGLAEARSAAAELANWPIGTIVSSDLERARDTADVLAESLGLEVATDHRLRETDLGEWSGKAHGEVDSVYPGQRSHWRLNPTWAPPGGETRLEVSERAASVVTELMASSAWDAGTVMLVAHGGTIGALTSRLLDVPVSHYPMFGGLGNTRWSQLVARPTDLEATGPEQWASARWFLEGWNVGVAAPPPVAVSNADEGDGRGVSAR